MPSMWHSILSTQTVLPAIEQKHPNMLEEQSNFNTSPHLLSRSSNKWIPIMENCPCLDWKPPSGHPFWTGNHHLHAKWIRWSASAWKIRTPWDWASLHCWTLVLSAGKLFFSFSLQLGRIRNRSFATNNAQKIYNWSGMILGQTRKSKDSFLRLNFPTALCSTSSDLYTWQGFF